MKKITTLLFIFLCLALSVQSQRYRVGRITVYERDIFGALKYKERDGFTASFNKNIFDDKIYEDSRGNKLKYSKKIIDSFHQEKGSISDDELFGELLSYFNNKKNIIEEFEIDIFDNLKYKNNTGFKASFSKSVLGDIVYEDSNGNEFKYEQKFLVVFDQQAIQNQNVYLFMDMLYPMMESKNYKEKYRINIFDEFEYENNKGVKVKEDIEQIKRHYIRNQNRHRIFLWDKFLNDYSN